MALTQISLERDYPAASDVLPVDASTPQRHFLIVSGPFGPFCTVLARRLRSAGARCTRVISNGGDILDWGLRSMAPYTGARAGWGRWIANRIRRARVTDVIVFGDSCPYSAEAIRQAQSEGVRTHVLEEGYFRPHWITLERDGVNGNSQLPREPQAYRSAAPSTRHGADVPVGGLDAALAARITLYHVGCYLGWPIFRGYRHPYLYSPLHQGLAHLRKYSSAFLARLSRAGAAVVDHDEGYFLVLLQRPGDSQIMRHSPFKSVSEMIELVLASFARHAPPDARLVLKAHPLDHGIERHDAHLRRLAERLDLGERVSYVEARPLAPMLDRARGVITVNSTGGLAALKAAIPTVTLGRAIYDLAGLTHQAGLDRFWSDPTPPDPELFGAFERVVMERTQVNGAFATRAGARLAAEGVAARLL
jgi:capsular polysaccharide export protein